MRPIVAIGLLVIILFVAGFAHASPGKSELAGAVIEPSPAMGCSNPEIVTIISPRAVFINPHLGWSTVPEERTILRCPLDLG